MSERNYNYWTEEEKLKLLEAVTLVTRGKSCVSWKAVSAYIPSRTLQQCKSFFQSLTVEQQYIKTAHEQFKALSGMELLRLIAYSQYYQNDWNAILPFFPNF